MNDVCWMNVVVIRYKQNINSFLYFFLKLCMKFTLKDAQINIFVHDYIIVVIIIFIIISFKRKFIILLFIIIKMIVYLFPRFSVIIYYVFFSI
jgi:hypothetical protein